MRRALLCIALLAAALTAWTLEPYVSAEEAEAPVVAAEVAPWSDSAKSVLYGLCEWTTPPSLVAPFCGCLVVEVEKRVPEDMFMLWIATEGVAHHDEVVRLGDEAYAVCKAKLETI